MPKHPVLSDTVKALLISAIAIGFSACETTPTQQERPPPAFLNYTGAQHCFAVAENSPFLQNRPPTQLPLSPHDNVWQRVQQGLSFNFINQARVHEQIQWYLQHPRYLQNSQRNAEKYLYAIVEQLHQANMPLDIALIPIIESGYNPNAYSSAKALGLWQFMPHTGKRFDLQQTDWVDDRRHITRSTEAAIRYFSYLHDLFDGDWLLAIAAYNAGEGRVARAIKENQRKGLATDFWQLTLPQETQDYVPKLIALSTMIKHAKQYNIKLPYVANSAYFETVVFSPFELHSVASSTQISVNEIRLLNPELKHSRSKNKSYPLNLPIQQYRQHLLQKQPP